MPINTAIQYTEQYLTKLDPNGSMDPFNFYDVVADDWFKEPTHIHEEFLDLIQDTFGTTSYIKVGTALNQFLVPAAEDRVNRLIELDAPVSIIVNAKWHLDSLKTNDAGPHILIAMLVVSVHKM